MINVFMTAYTGIQISMPKMPAILPAPINSKIMVRGWIFMDLPNNSGLIKLPSNCWITKIDSPMYNACNGEIKSPTITAGTAPINGPTYGIIFATPQKIANSSP